MPPGNGTLAAAMARGPHRRVSVGGGARRPHKVPGAQRWVRERSDEKPSAAPTAEAKRGASYSYALLLIPSYLEL